VGGVAANGDAKTEIVKPNFRWVLD
jgi:hypothetical protein